MFQALVKDHPQAKGLADALSACRSHFVTAAGFSALTNMLYLAPTLYMMQVYNRVVPTGGLTTLAVLTVVVMLSLATLSALDSIRTRLLVRAGLRLDRLLADQVLSRVVADPRSSDKGSQAMRDFDNVRSALTGPGVVALLDAPWSLIFLLVCFILHPLLGLLTLGGAVVLLVLAVLNERDTRPRLKRAIAATNAAYQAQGSMTRQSEVVRALGMRRAMIARQLEARDEATTAHAEAQLNGGGFRGLIKFSRLAMQSIALGLGAYLAVRGEVSVGAIIAASVLLSRTVAPIEQAVGAWPSLVQAWASWKTLLELFTATADPERDRTALPAPVGQLFVDKVGVRFKEGDNPQLKPLSLTVDPGQILGVVGPSGSGKTTLARVMGGGITPTLGAMRLDGADYRNWDSERLARHIGYLPQRATLFAGSIRDNIARFAADVGTPREEVDHKAVEAAKTAGVHEMILALPGGYDAVLGQEGAGLSAGQSQRIALARALYDDPHLVVLDEPNSNLDQDGEAALTLAMNRVKARGGIVVIVAHRAGILAIADRLLVMKNGSIELLGPRQEVLERLAPKRPGPRVASVQ